MRSSLLSLRTLTCSIAVAAIALVPLAGESANLLTETGRVVDLDSGRPVAGATVVITRALVGQPGVAGIGTTATTAADGSFTVANLPEGPADLQIFPENGYPALHEAVRVTAGSGSASVSVAKPTPPEIAWLAKINAERAAYGENPVVFDQGAIASARYWATYMATHRYFNHLMPNADPDASTPGDDTPVTRYLKFSGLTLDQTNGQSENIAEVEGDDSSWADAQALFMAEKANCPGGNPVGCAFTESTGHFLNVLNPNFKWVGLGITKIGDATYFDQEFVVGA